jgi:LCP family protein required for cell wall assembly
MMMYSRKRFIKILLFALIIAALLSSCNAPNFGIPDLGITNWNIFGGDSGTGNPVAFFVDASGAAPTPTPFQPLNPTPTFIPTAMPTLEPTPTPAGDPNSGGDDGPVGRLVLPKNQINVLLLGSDQRISRGGFRTDTIILVSVNTDTKSVSMVSFPRDLYVLIPGWTHQRINTAMFHGGFELLAKTLDHNFGVNPKYYVLVNFSAFKKIIDSLGGIDVEVARTYTDEYWDKSYKTIPAGTVHMNASIALWYARARKASNDFDRARRQQEVLHAIAKRLLSLNTLENAKELYDIYSDNVYTNLTWSEVAPMIPLLVNFQDPSLINRYVIGPGEVYDWITTGGAMVLLPRYDKIHALLKEALGAP